MSLMHVFNVKLRFQVRKLKKNIIIKVLDNVITPSFHKDKSLKIHIFSEEYVEFYSSIVRFVTWRFKDLVHGKQRRCFLTQIPFVTFRRCLRLYVELNSWKLFWQSPWPVWLYGLFDLELFHGRIFPSWSDMKLATPFYGNVIQCNRRTSPSEASSGFHNFSIAGY